jgi:hypothetical protein
MQHLTRGGTRRHLCMELFPEVRRFEGASLLAARWNGMFSTGALGGADERLDVGWRCSMELAFLALWFLRLLFFESVFVFAISCA